MRKIAIIFGGHSTEYEVSLQSAAAVFENINTEEFEVFPIGITKAGDWYHYTGELSKIAAGTWCNDASHLNKVAFSQDRSVGGFLELLDGRYTVQKIDLAFPVLHGKNGEDGTVQGLLELAGVPIVAAAHWLLLCVWTKTEHISWFRLRGFLYPNRLLSKNRRSTMRYRKSRTPYLSQFS